MFDGDFVFKGGIGRTDMEGANAVDMKLSIQNLLHYPENTTLYPGHGPHTTIGEEKKNLIYFTKVL
jgi:glyoxylase-like metal-dependent hydrolase (beta-lactamase superfamily II)